MKTNYAKPEAFICAGKDRQRIYNGNIVYLKHKQEFQFEFINLTSDNIMAKISINGKSISNRGLVLRVGQRGYLDRYIDDARKFLFETYTVDGKSDAVKKAIESNGDIKIDFFREKQKPAPAPWTIWPLNNRGYIPPTDAVYYDGQTGSPYLGRSIYTNQVGTSFGSIDFAPEARSAGNACADSLADMDQEFSRSIVSKKLRSKKTIETGRVEKGSTSDQYFTSVNMDFEYCAFHTVTYKLLPESQKPAELADFILKCKSCGAKIKSNWKVCPICGHPINNECKCLSCSTKVEPAWEFCPTCGKSLK